MTEKKYKSNDNDYKGIILKTDSGDNINVNYNKKKLFKTAHYYRLKRRECSLMLM